MSDRHEESDKFGNFPKGGVATPSTLPLDLWAETTFIRLAHKLTSLGLADCTHVDHELPRNTPRNFSD